MKKTVLIATSIIVSALAITSCDKVKDSVPPTLDKIVVSKNPCHPGDTITLTATIKNEGENWYFQKQSFTIGDSVIYSAIREQYKPLSNPPTCTYVVPENAGGTQQVKFSSTVSLTSGNKLYEALPALNGTFTVERNNEE